MPNVYLVQEGVEMATIEDRVAALEAEVERIKERMGEVATASAKEETQPWFVRFYGVFENAPDFEEVVRLGEEWRALAIPDAVNPDEFSTRTRRGK
jgi:hypothetical protein